MIIKHQKKKQKWKRQREAKRGKGKAGELAASGGGRRRPAATTCGENWREMKYDDVAKMAGRQVS